MTAANFMWAVVAGRSHSSEQLGRSFTEDLDDAKAKVNEHAERLRREGRTDWFGAVHDLERPTIIAPPGSTQPMLAWERVYFVDGRDRGRPPQAIHRPWLVKARRSSRPGPPTTLCCGKERTR